MSKAKAQDLAGWERVEQLFEEFSKIDISKTSPKDYRDKLHFFILRSFQALSKGEDPKEPPPEKPPLPSWRIGGNKPNSTDHFRYVLDQILGWSEAEILKVPVKDLQTIALSKWTSRQYKDWKSEHEQAKEKKRSFWSRKKNKVKV